MTQYVNVYKFYDTVRLENYHLSLVFTAGA